MNVGFHLWVLGEFGVRANEHDIFPLVFSHYEIEIKNFSPMLLVKAGAGHTHCTSQCPVGVSKEAVLFGGENVRRRNKRCLLP